VQFMGTDVQDECRMKDACFDISVSYLAFLVNFAEESTGAVFTAAEGRQPLTYDEFQAYRRSKEMDRQSHFQKAPGKRRKNKETVSVSAFLEIPHVRNTT